MNYSCSGCHQNISSPVSYSNCIHTSFGKHNLPFEIIICPNCKVCTALRISNSLKNIDQWLKSSQNKNGWLPVESVEDGIIVFIMSQILYQNTAGSTDPLFDMPDPEDSCKIFWKNGCALGYYSAKRKGAIVYATREVYSTLTLDTAYILPTFRGKGLGMSIFEDLIFDHPGEDLAISTPISKPMAHVIHKFLQKEPKYKLKLWEIDGVGSEGCKKLLYFTIKNKLT